VGIPGHQDSARPGHALHPGPQIRGVSNSGVVHPKVIPNGSDDYRTGVKADAHLELHAGLLPYFVAILSHSLLDGQCRVTGPMGMVLMGQGSSKQGHDAVTGKLINGSLIFVDLIHEDLETSIHDLVDFLGVEFLGDGGVVGYVGEEDGDELPFALDGASGREDFVGQEFGCVGLRLGVVDS